MYQHENLFSLMSVSFLSCYNYLVLLLDLFCGPGGAARGYAEAGFEVIGVDTEFNPHYPFEMFVGDALSFASRFGSHFDIIHASPPCQQFSSLNAIHKKNYPDYIEATRKVCKTLKQPYIIENVVGSPLKDPIMLCGTMFPELRVIRHRLFESNIPLVPPPHLPEKDHPIVHTLDRRNKNFGKT